MALFFTDTQTILDEEPFTAIWLHYEAARFLYPAKLERLAPALSLIREGWPQLLSAPADIFQFHAACLNSTIVSSICAFRDTDTTYVVQHAASQGQPHLMLNCIRGCLSTINADPSFQFARMYFRPQNRWPVRAAHSIADAMPETHCVFSTEDYLTCVPSTTMASSLPESIPLEVSDLPPADYKQASALATAAIGPLRATALGLGPESVQPDNVTLHALDQHYLEYGLRRTRRLLAVYQEGALVGLALCHANSIPMNFSFLCRRTEILVHPNASNRDTVVTALARASIAEAAVRGDSLCALLISPRDTPAALKAGYIDTHKQYASLLWSREDELGAPSALEGVERLYTAMEARLSMRQATIPAARKLNSQT